MAKKIDALKVELVGDSDVYTNPVFMSGPAEYLCLVIAKLLKLEPHFAAIFGTDIDEYMRMDYGFTNLPAMRIYNKSYRKEFDSWFIKGDIVCDVILPADLRREELQRFTDLMCSAVVQQFRRPEFFIELEEALPGLNELGKSVDVDKALVFEWGDNQAPLTQIVLNFRIDLRMWDDYLEQTNRTKDSPFEETLDALKRLNGTLIGLNDQDVTEVEIGIDQKDMEE